jgi:hypothetical protein
MNIEQLETNFSLISTLASAIQKRNSRFSDFEACQIAIGVHKNTILETALFDSDGESAVHKIADYTGEANDNLSALTDEVAEKLQNLATSFLEK